MSFTLYGRPVPRDREDFPDDLKFALRKRYGDSGTVRHRFDRGDMAYLEGLKDAGVEGALKLMQMIEKHGEIDVWEER